MKIYLSPICILLSLTLQSQKTINDSLPYATIPEAHENFTPGTVLSRVIDGLGFRYYWASEGLLAANSECAPGNEGRSIKQTLDHIYGLSAVILNAAKKQPNNSTTQPEKLDSKAQRKKTLKNLWEASELFAASEDLNTHNIIFESENGVVSYPLWNGINGPIEDALWHAGQIVVLRRAAGNPINSKVNVFLGKLNE